MCCRVYPGISEAEFLRALEAQKRVEESPPVTWSKSNYSSSTLDLLQDEHATVVTRELAPDEWAFGICRKESQVSNGALLSFRGSLFRPPGKQFAAPKHAPKHAPTCRHWIPGKQFAAPLHAPTCRPWTPRDLCRCIPQSCFGWALAVAQILKVEWDAWLALGHSDVLNDIADAIVAAMQWDFDAVHVRRGDKVDPRFYPHLDHDTQPEQ